MKGCQGNTGATGDVAITECHSSSDKLELKRIMRCKQTWMWHKRNSRWEKGSTCTAAQSGIWESWKWVRRLKSSGEEIEQVGRRNYVYILTHNSVGAKFGPILKSGELDGPGQMLLLTHSAWRSQPRVGIPKGITDVFNLHILCNCFWCSSSLSSSFLLMLFYAAVGMTNSIVRCAKGKKVGQEMDTCVIQKNHKFRGMVVFLHPFML